jgi:hypothetical protein
MKNSICIVIEHGWIIKGVEVKSTKEKLVLKDASVVRRWSNGKGIGGIAKAENKNEYTLDYIGDVEIRQCKVLFEIPCEW